MTAETLEQVQSLKKHTFDLGMKSKLSNNGNTGAEFINLFLTLAEKENEIMNKIKAELIEETNRLRAGNEPF